jgi:hypothetical protein
MEYLTSTFSMENEYSLSHVRRPRGAWEQDFLFAEYRFFSLDTVGFAVKSATIPPISPKIAVNLH